MSQLINCVIFTLCWKLTASGGDTYTAGFVNTASTSTAPEAVLPLVSRAANAGVDILLLPAQPTEVSAQRRDYDERVEALSLAARRGRVYVVSHLYEEGQCQNERATFRSNLVFDRNGEVVALYRKPTDSANCNTTHTEVGEFTTDFGVTFGLLMDEDLILHNIQDSNSPKNFITTGASSSYIRLLSGAHFVSSWAYAKGANVLTNHGIFGAEGLAAPLERDNIAIAKLQKTGANANLDSYMTKSWKLSALAEDLSQSVVKPLDVDAASRGYNDTVCHQAFCCEFFIKTKVMDSLWTESTSYCLMAFDGVRRHSARRYIGVQSCALLAAPLYKRTSSEMVNNTNIMFEKISMSANFSGGRSAQFPLFISTADHNPSFKFSAGGSSNKQPPTVTFEASSDKGLLYVGIFGRVFTKDYETEHEMRNSSDWLESGVYHYLHSEDLQQLFDYLWIRVRLLIFVVSIYILEMM